MMCIISGGQTGVDRAALDVALALGIPCKGWCPKGRVAEDGVLDERYPLQETPSDDYAQRTEWNVRDTDGTLLVCDGPLTGGTALTATYARMHDKAFFVYNLAVHVGVDVIRAWLREEHVRTLNVAGPRESKVPGIYQRAYYVLETMLHE